jgi:sec-independent protein translocase protein TatA
MTAPQAIFGLGVPELLIILAVVLLLFGGARLAGLGKSTGRAIKEFKEETKGIKANEATDAERPTTAPPAPQPPAQDSGTWQQPPSGNVQDSPSGDVRRDV